MVVYDITNRQSFDNLDSWISDFREIAGEHAAIMIVGNKCDRSDERVIPSAEASQWAADHGYEFSETSALNGEGVMAMFEKLTDLATLVIIPPPSEGPRASVEEKRCC
jgi:GTPase SAR1 family protein